MDKLMEFYDPYVGNFGLTENDLFENMNTILMYLEEHTDYALIYQCYEEYEGRNWWLTPQITLECF